MPMLALAALVAAGETDAVTLWLVYCSLMVLLALNVDGGSSSGHDDNELASFVQAACLCLLPFVVYASLRLHAIATTVLPATPGPAAWAIAALAVCLVWALLHTAGLVLWGKGLAYLHLGAGAVVLLVLQVGILLELVETGHQGDQGDVGGHHR